MALLRFSSSNVSGVQSSAFNGGAGQAAVGPLPAGISGYSSYAVDPDVPNTGVQTPLYGVNDDGSHTRIADVDRIGVERITIGGNTFGTSGFVVDNESAFALQTTTGQPIIFSNTPLIDGQTITFTATQGDFQSAVCFTTGTLIRTARGEVAVEDLIVGDLAVAASGELRPITWIGNREIVAAADPVPFNQQPVRVRAGAFGRGLPVRDLFLSPGHPVLVGADADNEGGVLVPVMCLINGTTVTREPVASVTYWHVELDSHDILLAEGLPAESYIDGGDRAFFSEASDHALHNPDFVPAGWNGRCRPVAVDGVMVEAERARLDAVFARTLNGQCAWDTIGFISFA